MAILSETIPVGEWLPDRADFENQGCLIAKNCIPDGEDYKPFPSFEPTTADLEEKGIGAFDHYGAGGTITKFLATRTKIYKVSGGVKTDVTNTGGDYTTPADGAWFFAQFGQRVIATNYVDNIQTFLVGTDTEFSDLISAGPNVKCRNIGVINNFVVGVDIDDDDGTTPNRVRWSPINDPAGNWTPSQSTQADYQNCEDGNPGQGMAVIGGQNYGVIVFRNAIYRMEYVGPPAIFNFILMEQGRGAVNPQAVTNNGSDVFYYHDTGFWQFNGSASIPIGQRKVDQTAQSLIDNTYFYNIRMAADPLNKNILMPFTSTESSDGENDKMFLYNWSNQRFTLIDQACQHIYRAFTEGYTLETLGAEYPVLEDVPYSLDSSFWSGGGVLLAGIVDGVMGYFQSTPMTATIETSEVRLNNDGLSYIQSVLPVFEGGSCTVSLGARKNVNGTVTYTPNIEASEETGEANFDLETRYVRASIELSGTWEYFQGVRYRAEAGSAI